MVDGNKIRGLIAEKRTSISDAAKALGITRQALSYKLNGERDFKCSEVGKLSIFLGIKNREIGSIFFIEVSP